ncbi:hypothetical protein KCU71_g9915, partial [Aureobasidium melanogenum]
MGQSWSSQTAGAESKSELNTVPIQHPEENFAAASKERTPIRLIICVDGTWTDIDGVNVPSLGNVTNIYRIHSMVKNGVFTIQLVGWEIFAPGNGTGPAGVDAMIAHLYETIASRNLGPEDELFFFGYSRGAYIVRCLANILHYLRVPKAHNDTTQIKRIYSTGLSLYESIRTSPKSCPGKINEYFKNCKQAHEMPVLKYVGVLDTVKAFDDKGIHDIGLVSSVLHYRQALALHESRKAFEPEPFVLSSPAQVYDMQQAWFVGAHADMGGANSKDGLSLYLLLWIVYEAKLVGLTLGGFVRQHFEIKEFRILICGESGIGKSTLINKTFGFPEGAQTAAQVSHDGAGIHDIEHGYSAPGFGVTIHDSCGFQAGNQKDVNDFKTLSKEESKNMIWLSDFILYGLYCVSCDRINKKRIHGSAEDMFMEALGPNNRVPVILIFTRKDELESIERGKIVKANASADPAVIESLVKRKVEKQLERMKTTYQKRWNGNCYESPVFVEEDDTDSIKAVMNRTLKNLALLNAFICYGHGVGWSSLPIPGTVLISMPIAVERACKAIMLAFNVSGFQIKIMLEVLSTVFLGNYESNTAQLGTQAINVGAFIADLMGTAGFGVIAGVSAQVCNILAVPQVGRVLIMVIADVTIIMDRAFWICKNFDRVGQEISVFLQH